LTIEIVRHVTTTISIIAKGPAPIIMLASVKKEAYPGKI
jgi:hypothetical protein